MTKPVAVGTTRSDRAVGAPSAIDRSWLAEGRRALQLEPPERWVEVEQGVVGEEVLAGVERLEAAVERGAQLPDVAGGGRVGGGMGRTYESARPGRIARIDHWRAVTAWCVLTTDATACPVPGRARRRRPSPRHVTTGRSLRKMFCTWRATVCALMTRIVAISRLVRPVATSRRTSNSRSVSSPCPVVVGASTAPRRSRSGVAPSRSNVARAASSSSSAASRSPSARQARAISDPGAGHVVGHVRATANRRARGGG